MLAHDLANLLRENISSRGAAQPLFADCLSPEKTRPLLLLYDRTSDMTPPLLHSATYQALVDDLLDHRLNRVTVDLPSSVTLPHGNKEQRKKTYDLNSQIDSFYGRFAARPFPEAIEANEKELVEVSQSEAAARSRPDGEQQKELGLTQVIESLPEILNRKTNLETHTNILQACMRRVADRQVPSYHELEQSLLAKTADRPAVLALLRDSGKGILADKLRLLLLMVTERRDEGWDELEQAFSQGCKGLAVPAADDEIKAAVAAAAFVRRLLAVQAGAGSSSSKDSGLASLLTSASSLLSQASAFNLFAGGTAYSLLPRLLHGLAAGSGTPEDEACCYLDPRKASKGHIREPLERVQKFTDAIVFVIGGGCYTEQLNLQEWARQKGQALGLRTVVYGCSELFNADGFTAQIKALAK